MSCSRPGCMRASIATLWRPTACASSCAMSTASRSKTRVASGARRETRVALRRETAAPKAAPRRARASRWRPEKAHELIEGRRRGVASRDGARRTAEWRGIAWRDHLASELRRAASGSRDIRRARQPARAGEAPVLVHVKRPPVAWWRLDTASRRAHCTLNMAY